jgi:hypothetical protein
VAGLGAAAAATLILKIVSDVSGAQKGLKDTATTAQKAEASIGGLAVPAAAAGAAVIGLGVVASNAASDVEQAFGAVESVFKGHSEVVKQLAEDSAVATGLASSDYAQMAAVLGAQLKNMGKDMNELAPATDELIRKGADLAATFGGPTSDAVNAISALLRGERDPIERYGVSIKQVDIDARLAADGIKTEEYAHKKLADAQAAVTKATAEVKKAHDDGTPAAKAAAAAHLANAQAALESAQSLTGLPPEAYKAAVANATLALLTDQTTDAQGAFARETDTAAHAQQVAAAEMKNAEAAIGQALLPAVVALSGALSALSKFATENKGAVLALGAVILGLSAAVVAVNVAFKLYRTAVMAAQAAQWLLNAAQNANPLGIILLAVMALVAGIILLWKNSETFRTIVTTVFNAVLAVVKTVVAWITTAFNALAGVLAKPFNAWLSVVKSVIGTIQGLFNGLMGVINHLLGIIGDLGKKVSSVLSNIPKLPFSLAAPPPAAAAVAAPTVRGLAPLSAIPTGGGRGQTNVTMVLDREVFGRVMIDSLRRYDRRNGAPQVLPRWS